MAVDIVDPLEDIASRLARIRIQIDEVDWRNLEEGRRDAEAVRRAVTLIAEEAAMLLVTAAEVESRTEGEGKSCRKDVDVRKDVLSALCRQIEIAVNLRRATLL